LRYRFGEFTLSTRSRVLLRGDTPVPLIPKYFELLLLLVERRDEALDRRVLFDAVWPDVVVSDGALTQAIRTLRRALDDDPRAPRYIRTVSRHGYQFVFAAVVCDEERPLTQGGAAAARPSPAAARDATFDVHLARLVGAPPYENASQEERREAAELLHAMGTADALARLNGHPGQARARALLRDARWDVPQAGPVPLLGAPAGFRAAAALIALRLRRAARAGAGRLGLGAVGCAAGGTLGGTVGGTALALTPGSPTTVSGVGALAIIGAVAGAFGGSMVGAGLAASEALARSRRRLALALCGAASGVAAGTLGHFAVRAVFDSVMGRAPAVLGGPLEGGLVGLAAGIGFGLSTHTPAGGGMATPHGRARVRVAIATGLCCALAGGMLGSVGASTVSVTLDRVAASYSGSQVGLAPLAAFLGEHDMRPVTRTLVSSFEGLLFGIGLALGLTHRPGLRRSS
jgi:DNA-binding winged helix-turn-helix (wHTH) protein